MSIRRKVSLLILLLGSLLWLLANTTSVKAPNATATPTKELIIQTTPTQAVPSPTPIVLEPTPYPKNIQYVVKPGDTLEKIAREHNLHLYNLSWIDLANLNQVTDPHLIFTNQTLLISFDPQVYESADPYFNDLILDVAENEKLIVVSLTAQKLYTYEGDKLLKSYYISSGTSNFPTITGIFKIQIKLESTTMSGEGYYLENVPHTMYFSGDYGIHGAYWHNNFGTPMSHGCVNMDEPDAEDLFYWAEVGTIVQVIP